MIEIATSPTTTTLVITGDLDLAERDQFPEIASRVVGLRRQLLVIDMCRVTFMDSTGAAFLISLADAGRKRGGATVLRGADERDLFVLEVCGALEMFRVDRDHSCEGTITGAVAFTRPESGSAQRRTTPLPQRKRTSPYAT
ncbi:MAG: STAS domain-containing protein [Promicromonosporaceae bacterium]|nr:STAS domain-containing protein [Promicromonosporaceae bacterium]